MKEQGNRSNLDCKIGIIFLHVLQRTVCFQSQSNRYGIIGDVCGVMLGAGVVYQHPRPNDHGALFS